ncbi:MAG: D-tyrosyl-tRNA(Tyr) deacylase [Thermoleophilia bacterium]|nr:D-tyrosyl-tRNA(Tyr) deacylase [Thermoleophilia bacterium]
MRAVVQRVRRARVLVDGRPVAAIGAGLCVLLGIAEGDGEERARTLARRVARLRVFENETGKLDLGVLDTGGSVLCVSQFTLIADTSRGNRPSFSAAARPERAEPLYEEFCAALRAEGVAVEAGVFGARMLVELENDGPVTILLEA